MEGKIIDSDTARNSAPIDYDKARHPLTIADAVELFAECSTPLSKRSVQRFCEQGHLDCVRIKGPRGDQFFINRESVVRYAEELRQIEAVAALSDEARYDAPQHAVARNSAPERDMGVEAITPTPQREPDDTDTVRRLKDENLNLRVDNRAKEFAIGELNRRLNEDRDKFVSAMQDMSYKLGAAETRLAQIEAPKTDSDTARQSTTCRASSLQLLSHRQHRPVRSQLRQCRWQYPKRPRQWHRQRRPPLSRADRFSGDCSGREGERRLSPQHPDHSRPDVTIRLWLSRTSKHGAKG